MLFLYILKSSAAGMISKTHSQHQRMHWLNTHPFLLLPVAALAIARLVISLTWCGVNVGHDRSKGQCVLYSILIS